MIGIIPQGDNVATAKQGGNVVTKSDAVSYLPNMTHDATFFRGKNNVIETAKTMTATIGGVRFTGKDGAPRTFHRYGKVEHVDHAKNLVFFNAYGGGLDDYDRLKGDMYVGGILRNMRLSNGVFDEVGFQPVTGAQMKPAKTKIVETTGELAVDRYPYYTLGDIWYRASHRDSNGQLSDFSPWIKFTITTSEGTGDHNPNEVDPTHVDGTGTAPTPTGLAAVHRDGSGHIDITWDAEPAAASTLIQRTWYDPALNADADAQDLGCIEVADSTQFQVGDLVYFEKLHTEFKWDWFTARVSNEGGAYNLHNHFRLLRKGPMTDRVYHKRWADNGGKPDANLGNWYTEITVHDGEEFELAQYAFGNAGQDYYLRPGTSTVAFDFWAEASAPMTIECAPGEPGSGYAYTVDVDQTGAWKHWEHTWSGDIPEGVSGVKEWAMRWTNNTGGDVVIKFASLHKYVVGDPYGHQGYIDAAGGVVSFIRDHGTCKPGNYHAGIEYLFDTDESGHLDRVWDLCELVGADPWDQITWAAGRDHFIAYGNRVVEALQAGRFNQFKLEWGNERWNHLTKFIPTLGMTDSVTGTEYTNYQMGGIIDAAIYRWMREGCPGFAELEAQGKIIKHYGGWSNNQSMNRSAEYAGTDVDEVGIASYTGGWDQGQGAATETIASFQSMVGLAGVLFEPNGPGGKLIEDCKFLSEQAGKTIRAASYELGPGYQHSGASNEQKMSQEVVGKSRASATAVLDMLCRFNEIGAEGNWFTLARYANTFQSHASNWRPFMPYELCRHLYLKTGKDFRVHPMLRAKRRTKGFLDKKGNADALEMVGATAFESLTYPGRWVIAARNLWIDESVFDPSDENYTTGTDNRAKIKVRGLFKSATSCELLSVGMGNCREHDRYGKPGYRADPETLDGAGDNQITIPDPLAVEFDYSWNAATLPANFDNFDLSEVIGEDLRGLNSALLVFEGVTS